MNRVARHFPLPYRSVGMLLMLTSALLIIYVGNLSCSPAAAASPSQTNSDTDTLQMDTFGATALILLDEERFEIKGKREAYWDHHIIKKILQSNHPEEGVFSFPEGSGREIISIEGTAVYPNGRTQIIDKDDIQSLPQFDNFVLYSDQKTRAFRFTGIRPGMVIDVRVRYKVRNLIYWEPAVFQDYLPILRKSYTLIHPPDIDININAVSMDVKPDRTNDVKDGRREFVWEREAIEPFEQESRMPPLQQFIPSLWFSIRGDQKLGKDIDLSSWNGIVEWYIELTHDHMNPGSHVKNVSILNESSDAVKAAAIYRRIQDDLRYVAIYLGLGGYDPHSCEEILKLGYGDCKDQSVALTAVLRESGIESHLVMVRTNDGGHLEDPAPSPGYFNHVIVAAEVDGETVFLDPTCGTCSYGILPHSVQGAHALVVRKGENRLTTLPVGQGRRNARSTYSGISIDSHGTATVIDTMVFEGTYASMYRWSFRRRSGNSPEKTAKDLFLGRYPLADVISVQLEGMDQASEELTLICHSTIPRFVKLRSTIFLDPLIYGLDFGDLQSEERIYPFDLGLARFNRYRMTMAVPNDMEASGIPEPLEIRNEHFTYQERWKEDAGGLVFDRVMEISDGLVQPAEYDTISSQLNEISKLESEKVVFRKMKP